MNNINSNNINFDDIYELLGVSFQATIREIAKAYRSKSLKYHPDKVGPDDEYAKDMFLRLTKAYDLLKDPVARKDYDLQYAAKLAQKKRMAEMEENRQKAKRDLDEREALAKKAKLDDAAEAFHIQQEVERLREEGLRKLKKQQQEKSKEHAQIIKKVQELKTEDEPFGLEATLSLKWSKEKHSFTERELELFFVGFGAVDKVLVSSNKKKGKGVVSFKSILAAHKAITSSLPKIKGIECTWALGTPPENLKKLLHNPSPSSSKDNKEELKDTTSTVNHEMAQDEYEEMVLMQMMQTQKAKST